MSTKPWPQLPPKQNAAVECKEVAEAPKPWSQNPQWPPKDCGHNAVAKVEVAAEVAKVETAAEAECGQAASLPVTHDGVTAPQKKGLAPPWKPGQSGNPKGRPISSKHKTTELMRSIILANVAEHAEETLDRIREKDPVAWFAIVLKFCPSELILKIEKGLGIDYSELSNEEFVELAEKRKRNWMMNTVLEKYGDR